LMADLKRRGADVAVATGSTPWEARALEQAGFRRVYDLDFMVRDREGLLPESIPEHVTFLEADYATLA
ncbi:MAG TPA: acetyltransferase, partial [Isosphaeraceae bacterium]|nr:acetyltransferase [Isosphaeraceae bacterium]